MMMNDVGVVGVGNGLGGWDGMGWELLVVGNREREVGSNISLHIPCIWSAGLESSAFTA